MLSNRRIRGSVNVSETFSISYTDEETLKEDSKYYRINMMLKTLDMQDDSTLLDMMADYVESEYIIGECYLPLT